MNVHKDAPQEHLSVGCVYNGFEISTLEGPFGGYSAWNGLFTYSAKSLLLLKQIVDRHLTRHKPRSGGKTLVDKYRGFTIWSVGNIPCANFKATRHDTRTIFGSTLEYIKGEIDRYHQEKTRPNYSARRPAKY